MSAFHPIADLEGIRQHERMKVVTGGKAERLFGSVAQVIVFLTLPALVVSALLLFLVIQPMSGLSAGAGWSLLVLAVALPFLCTWGPARASIARAQRRPVVGWLWLSAPVFCFAAIAVLVIFNRA